MALMHGDKLIICDR